MNFWQLVSIVGEEPVFETGLLLAGKVDPADVRRQLSRWKKAGRIYQVRRGLYALAPPFQKVKPHPFLVANRMVRGSYVSCQSALAFGGHIPEYVPVTTSVSASRPARWNTPLGRFEFRHIKSELVAGYRSTEVSPGQFALVAWPEKALLDLVHLEPGGDRSEYLSELRLQNLESLDEERLAYFGRKSGSPKLQRAVRVIADLAEREAADYEQL